MTDEQLAIFMRQIVERLINAAATTETVLRIDNVPENTRRAAMVPFETLVRSLQRDAQDLLGES
jgi:hypothetical protein